MKSCVGDIKLDWKGGGAEGRGKLVGRTIVAKVEFSKPDEKLNVLRTKKRKKWSSVIKNGARLVFQEIERHLQSALLERMRVE